MINSCKECGCTCKNCYKNDNEIHLHIEIENLKQKLLDRDNHIIKLETNFLKEHSSSDELVLLRDELIIWQEKFQRLSDAHKRVQRVNQGLEDKLLKLVDTCETDKNALTKDVAILSQKLAEANYTIKKLNESNDRYKNDVSLAIQFLQCKQSNFVGQKYDTLPPEVQSQVSMYMTNKRKPEEKKISEAKSIKVPIPTFPPTAMVYSVPKLPTTEEKQTLEPQTPPVDIVSAAIMAKVLEERQRERMCIKHCDTCTCSKTIKFSDSGSSYLDTSTQTDDFDACKTCSDIQNNLQVKNLRNSEKVPNSDVENHNNIAKVQPNNFLVEKSSSNTSSQLELNVSLDGSSLTCSDDKSFVNRHAFTNQTESRTKPRRKSDIPQNHEFPVSSKLQLGYPVETMGSKAFKNRENSNFRLGSTTQSKQKTNVDELKNDCKRIDHSSDKKIPIDPKNDFRQNQREFQNILEDSACLSINHENIDKKKYAEMENHVKQFLFGKTELWKENADSVNLSSSNSTFSNIQTEI